MVPCINERTGRFRKGASDDGAARAVDDGRSVPGRLLPPEPRRPGRVVPHALARRVLLGLRRVWPLAGGVVETTVAGACRLDAAAPPCRLRRGPLGDRSLRPR